MSAILARTFMRPRKSEVIFLLVGVGVFAAALATYGIYCAVCDVPAAVTAFA